MAKDQPEKTKRPSARNFKLEPEIKGFLPYARHVTEHIVALDNQSLMVTIALDGTSFETADREEINSWHTRLNSTWRNLADDRLAIWTHIVRREDDNYPDGEFRSTFARDLDARYRQRITSTKLYLNELYVTLLVHPRPSPGEMLSKLFPKKKTAELDEESVKFITDKTRDAMQYLGRYSPRLLSTYDHNGVVFSETMEAMQLILTGQKRRIPLVRGHLGNALYASRLIFGRESMEIRDAAGTAYAGIFGVKEYPARTVPGLWDELLKARFPFTISQSFAFLSKASARGIMERKQNQMINANDRASSQVQGIDEALDDLLSNRFVMGSHQFSLTIFGDTIPALDKNMSIGRARLADSGMVVAREDLALESAFWSQFPGNFSYRVRPGAITSRNFAALSPFHTFPAGRPSGNHWGQAVALLRTSAQSPFYFNFHNGDLGHTFICGPSGSGKTVVQNFMLSMLEKLGVQQIFIDKDRGAEIFVRASGGVYLPIKNGVPTGFAPFKALEYTPSNMTFLNALLRNIVTPQNRALTVQEERLIDGAILALKPLPPAQRSIAALRSLLGQKDAEGIGARHRPYHT